MISHGATRPIAPAREAIALERARRAAKLRGATDLARSRRVPTTLARQAFKRDGFACVYCGADERLCADHVWPDICGGALALDNMQTLCGECNRWKWLSPVELVRIGGQLYARKLPFPGKVR